MNTNYGLIIFDVDGTLAAYQTNKLLPGVCEWFEQHGSDQYIAIASNQGGVGLRWWMITEGFGEPDRYPDAEDIDNSIQAVLNQLPEQFRDLPVFVCYAYQSKKTGKWSPVPVLIDSANNYRWDREYRKPAPGMLRRAMHEAGVGARSTLMVGDSAEDEAAAQAAGCDFILADVFFGRGEADKA